MKQHTFIIVFVIVTVVYLVVMGILFWRYRVSMHKLSEKLRQCAAEQKEKEVRMQKEIEDEVFEKL